MNRLQQYYEICRIRPAPQRSPPVYDLRPATLVARRTGNYKPLTPGLVAGGAEGGTCLVITYEE